MKNEDIYVIQPEMDTILERTISGYTLFYGAPKRDCRTYIQFGKWLTCWTDQKFNWLQKKMWRLLLGIEIKEGNPDEEYRKRAINTK